MELPVAYCGLKCSTCPVHLATIEQDENRRLKLRQVIAEGCTRQYKKPFLPEDITDCDGCRSISGKLLKGCLDCDIRTCAVERNLESCAYCPDYACETLSRHLEFDKTAKEHLEALRVRN